MHPISLCMVVHNASLNLRHCLNRVSRFVSEIVIVDDASTDKTIAVAKEFTDFVYKMPKAEFCEPYRQLSIDLATQPWVFILDDDECPDDGLLNNLGFMLKTGHDGFRFERRSFLKGQFVWDDPDQSRLFLKRPELFWQNRIHNRATGYQSLSPIMQDMFLLHFHSSNEELEEKDKRYNRIIKEWLPYWDKETTELPRLLKQLHSEGCPIIGEVPFDRIDSEWVKKRKLV